MHCIQVRCLSRQPVAIFTPVATPFVSHGQSGVGGSFALHNRVLITKGSELACSGIESHDHMMKVDK